MGPAYAIEGSHGTAADTAVGLQSVAIARPHCYYVGISSETNSADNTDVYEVKLADGTGAGTSTGVTPKPLNDGFAASDATGEQAYSAEPTTYDAVPMLKVGLNQKLFFQWFAREGGELVVPAVANATLGIFIVSQETASSTSGVFHFFE